MLELPSAPNHLPLHLASRVLSAPGVWTPSSRLSLTGLGALVTPPLGEEWDGDAMSWEARAGGFVWAPPRRPVDRLARRIARVRSDLPRIWTLAVDTAREMAHVVGKLEYEGSAGYLLWEATPEMAAAARQVAPALPILVESPCTEIGEAAAALVEAGADGLWVGPPRISGQKSEHVGRRVEERSRLWGPAVLPLLVGALGDRRLRELGVPLIAGAGIGSAKDAQRVREAGAEAVALDVAWWVVPGLAVQVAKVEEADL